MFDNLREKRARKVTLADYVGVPRHLARIIVRNVNRGFRPDEQRRWNAIAGGRRQEPVESSVEQAAN